MLHSRYNEHKRYNLLLNLNTNIEIYNSIKCKGIRKIKVFQKQGETYLRTCRTQPSICSVGVLCCSLITKRWLRKMHV